MMTRYICMCSKKFTFTSLWKLFRAAQRYIRQQQATSPSTAPTKKTIDHSTPPQTRIDRCGDERIACPYSPTARAYSNSNFPTRKKRKLGRLPGQWRILAPSIARRHEHRPPKYPASEGPALAMPARALPQRTCS